MKKILYVAAILSITISCTKEIQSIDEGAVHTFRISTSAPTLEAGDINSTKASIKANISLRWSDGDLISIVNLTTGKTMLGNLTASVSGDKVKFEGDLSGSVTAGDKLAAIYPCQNYTSIASVPDFTFDLSEQNCTTKDDLKFAAYSVFTCTSTGVVEVSADFTVPVSFNQISISGITPDADINWIKLTNVGNSIGFHVNSEKEGLELTPSVGDVKIIPTSKKSNSNGALFAYCALAASPAAARELTVADSSSHLFNWASSEMTDSKYYTSLVSNPGIFFPDANLRHYMVEKFDANKDGIISETESALVDSVVCCGLGISDITGLDKCRNLLYLNCSDNIFTNLIINNPALKSLDASNNTNLAEINLSKICKLTNLVLSNCAINTLWIADSCGLKYIQSIETDIIRHLAVDNNILFADHVKFSTKENAIQFDLDSNHVSISMNVAEPKKQSEAIKYWESYGLNIPTLEEGRFIFSNKKRFLEMFKILGIGSPYFDSQCLWLSDVYKSTWWYDSYFMDFTNGNYSMHSDSCGNEPKETLGSFGYKSFVY